MPLNELDVIMTRKTTQGNEILYPATKANLVLEDEEHKFVAAAQKTALDKTSSLKKDIIVDTNWSEDNGIFSKVIQVQEINSTDFIAIYPVYSDDGISEYHKIESVESLQNGIRLTCNKKPELEFKIRIGVI